MSKRIAIAIAMAASACVDPAQATTFTVVATADVADAVPGDGVCSVFPMPSPPVCTLRAAITEANALAGADQINLSAGQVFTLAADGAGENNGFTGDLDITDDLSIRFLASGDRPRVIGPADDRVFHILSGNVTFIGFEITGGHATSALATSGGGIFVNSTAGAVNLVLMRVFDNSAQLGGGLYNAGADTSVSASEFHDNHFVGDINATPSGSAIRNRGNLVIEYSTVYRNSGSDEGTDSANAIESSPQGADTGSVTIVNSTLVGNTGNAVNMEEDGFLSLSGVTIAGNSVRGVRMTGTGGQFNMRDTVVANNAFADCQLTATGLALNLDRYNLDSDDSCELASGASNFPATEPYLTPLNYHGGPTPVSWPLTRSPLLEQGHPVVISFGCEEDDQQFDDRPVDFDADGSARCDIGAVELDADVIFFDPLEHL